MIEMNEWQSWLFFLNASFKFYEGLFPELNENFMEFIKSGGQHLPVIISSLNTTHLNAPNSNLQIQTVVNNE